MTEEVKAAIIISVGPMVAAVATIIVAMRRTNSKIQQVHLQLNSRLTQWKKDMIKLAFEAGKKSEKNRKKK